MKSSTRILLAYCLALASTQMAAASPWSASSLKDFFSNLFSSTKPAHTKPHASYSKPTYQPRDGYSMTERQARDYIDQSVAALDYALRPCIKDRALMQLKDMIFTAVRNASGSYRWTSYGKYYNKEIIDQYINSAVLEYIEQTSYRYAYKQTNNSTVARKISESMRNNALARIQQTGALDAEALAPFVGDALKRAVREQMNRYDVPTQQNYRPNDYIPTPPPANNTVYEEKLFPSELCCSCLESFDNVPRLFLYPCGHDMCKDCAYEWFFVPERNEYKACPHCRSKVNLDRLSVDVASAPDADAN